MTQQANQQPPQQQYAQQPQQFQQAPGMVPGIQVVAGNEEMVPQFLVIAREKEGKSATVGTTLVNYPRAGMHPLFFAFDATGPNSCLKLGYRPHVMAIKRLPGASIWDKTREGLARLEANVSTIRQTYGSIVVDCGSTMVDLFHEAARKGKNPDPRSHFGDALMWSRETMHRLAALELPIWWLAWLREPETVEESAPGGVKVKKILQGGPNILGNFKALLAGKVQHIFILEKQNVGVGRPGADEAGFVRMFHTRDYMNIRAGGRFSHLLPPLVVADCGGISRVVVPPT